MNKEDEEQVCERIRITLTRMRLSSFRLGCACTSHIENAEAIIRGEPFGKVWVQDLSDEEEAQYLRDLPQLMSQTEDLNSTCGELWDEGSTESRLRYHDEHIQLCQLFMQFKYDLLFYERCLHLFRHANPELGIHFASPSSDSSSCHDIADSLRLPLSEVLRLWVTTEDLISQLDRARDELADSHFYLVEECVSSFPSADESTLLAAKGALRRAAARFDSTRGYRFATYAKQWIEAVTQRYEQGKTS